MSKQIELFDWFFEITLYWKPYLKYSQFYHLTYSEKIRE
jgi:hypothetical protein